MAQKLGAEFLGTAFMLATVIGAGIMGERLAGGNVALALLCNTLPTGAILVVLITMLAPISGAHLNPAVTLTFYLKREIAPGDALACVIVQLIGALVGVLAAHAMFELPLLQLSTKMRSGTAQAFSEWVPTFGLILTILLTLRAKRRAAGLSGAPLHHRRLLVHCVHLICEPCRHCSAGVLRHLRGHTTKRCGAVYRRSVAWGGMRARLLPSLGGQLSSKTRGQPRQNRNFVRQFSDHNTPPHATLPSPLAQETRRCLVRRRHPPTRRR